jgi:Zn-dependent peptidase ImmA (M78 family)
MSWSSSNITGRVARAPPALTTFRPVGPIADDGDVGIDSNRGAKRAREAREELGLDPIAPLACLLTVVEEQLGLPVVVAALPEEVAGACWRDGGKALLWVNGTQAAPRRRFTLAHEVAHAWCKHDGALGWDTFQTLSGRTTNPLEIQANAFAAEFLMPKEGVCELFDSHGPGLDELVVLAAGYGTSALAALIRLETAGLVGEERAARLREEIEEGHHFEAMRRLRVEQRSDRLGAIADLPYTSPSLAGSALAAALGGAVGVDDAAHAAGVAPERLAPALESISRPGRAA